jgi:Transposase DDE domain group 1
MLVANRTRRANGRRAGRTAALASPGDEKCGPVATIVSGRNKPADSSRDASMPRRRAHCHATRGWRGQCAYIDAAHRVHARVEDVIRTGKNTGLGHFPSHDYGLNQAWLDAAMIACILLSWLKLLALDGDLARAEPKTLRYRVLHTAARLVRGSRRRTLKIAATWPWAEQIVTAWQRVQAIPHPT